ncbi:enhancer of polycomb-like-domain-containing protein [Mrakia frigida]|uniref:Epl1p n=1 Tax=Mrakia frigida TaxID=29902 RepID=UPI003FCC0DA4
MLKSRRQARLTNKSKLAVYRGELEGSELFSLDSEENGKSNLNSDGVEKGEDQEHHLQAAISAAAIRAASSHVVVASPSSSSNRSSTTNLKPPPPVAENLYHIPTPDATGVVADYASLYVPQRWTDPSSYVRFSDTVEETTGGPAGLGYSYTLDERDDEWLKNNNRAARGEGTSASGASVSSSTTNGVGSPTEAGRGTRGKGKDREREKEEMVVPVISEDEFELVMALMERWTDEKLPTLHTDLNRMPTFADMESVFSHPLPPPFFPNFIVPPAVPVPGILCRMAKAVFPHWKDRRIMAEGKSIIPQLNYDESNDGDPYVCFRRREAKPVRKTRRTDSQSVDRLVLLQAELLKAQQLALDTLVRERRKAELVTCEREAWDAKIRLIEVKRKYPTVGHKPEDEDMLFKTGIGAAKKQRVEGSYVESRPEKLSKSAPGVGGGSRKSMGGRDSVSSPAPGQEGKEKREPGERTMPVEALRERTLAIAMQIERDVARKREGDYQWEDMTDVAYQPPLVSAPIRLFRPLLPDNTFPPTSSTPPSSSSSSSRSSTPGRTSAFRLRRGRGGIIRLDRRSEPRSEPPPRQQPHWRMDRRDAREALVDSLFADEWTSLPSTRRTRIEEDVEPMDGVVEAKEMGSDEFARRISERWRYDSEAGVVGVGMGLKGLDGEERVIIDDFEDRHIRIRATLLSDNDNSILSPDNSHLLAAERAAEEPPERPPPVILVRPAPLPAAPPRRVDSGGPRPPGLVGQPPPLMGGPVPNGQGPIPNGGPQGKKVLGTPQQQQQQAQQRQQQQQQRSMGANGARPHPGQQGSPPLPHPNGIARPGSNGYLPNGIDASSSPNQSQAALPRGAQQPFSNGGGFPENGNGQQRGQGQGGPRNSNGASANFNFDGAGVPPTKEQIAALKLQMAASQRAQAQAQAAANGNPGSPNFPFNAPVLNLKPPPPGRNPNPNGTPAQQAAWRSQQARLANGQVPQQVRSTSTSSPVPPHMSPRLQHVGSG